MVIHTQICAYLQAQTVTAVGRNTSGAASTTAFLMDEAIASIKPKQQKKKAKSVTHFHFPMKF